jgi:hypothetical protein
MQSDGGNVSDGPNVVTLRYGRPAIGHISAHLGFLRNNGYERAFNRCVTTIFRRYIMGRGILLWLLGVPLPIIILLALFVR